MQTILDHPEELIVRFTGWERVWTLRGSVVLPRERIRGAVWHEDYQSPALLWRVGGTGLPGALYAGYWRSADGQPYFLYMRRPRGLFSVSAEKILEIKVANDAGSLTTFLLSVSAEQAQTILSWYNASK